MFRSVTLWRLRLPLLFRTGVALRFPVPEGVDRRPLLAAGAAVDGEESPRSGTLMVLVTAPPAASPSSCSASTVTLIFQGLRFCSVTVRDGETGNVIAPCAERLGEAVEKFLLLRSDFPGDDSRRLGGDGERVATGN
jgi:hypothetical protein